MTESEPNQNRLIESLQVQTQRISALATKAGAVLTAALLASSALYPSTANEPGNRNAESISSLTPDVIDDQDFELMAYPTQTTTEPKPYVHWHSTSVWKRIRDAHTHTPPPAPEPSPTPNQAPGNPYRYMSPDDFVKVWYEVQPQPGTVYGSKPSIYGYVKGDPRIRQIAEGRGYRLQPLGTTGGMNSTAINAFNMMAAAAKREANIGMTIVSGFRTPSRQAYLFKQRVAEHYGQTPSENNILSGSADSAINKTLNLRSVPGYSRHHSGYVVDINRTDNSFAQTAAYKWLSSRNFTNARRFCFVPSYPAGTTIKTGPQPESWEFSYIANCKRVQQPNS
jgi:hypothetical protein